MSDGSLVVDAIREIAAAYLRTGARSLAPWVPDDVAPLFGERIENFLKGNSGAGQCMLRRGIAAVAGVRIEEAVKNLTAVATLPAEDTDIRALSLKEKACLYLAIALLQGFGQLDEAVFWLRERQRIADILARHDGDHDPSEQIFDQFWSSHVGHTAMLGLHVKRHLLRPGAIRKLYLLGSKDGSLGNRHLVDRWRKYFTILDEAVAHPFQPLRAQYAAKCIYLEPLLNGAEGYFWQAYAEISKAWEQSSIGPLFELSDEEWRQGNATLEVLGLPKDAWYVCLHVRSAGFKRTHDELHKTLNADIYSYELAIEAIVERGGWVIRMGDPSMPKLFPSKNVIDYAHSRHKSAMMDIFLCGSCRFYVGTSSGLAYVPSLFGVPSVMTNWFPVGTRPLNSYDLYIPKLHWQIAANAHVPLDESLAPPLGHIHAERTLAELGISIIDNTSEELRDVVVEMIDRLDGSLSYDSEDESLQARFSAVAEASRCFGLARIGRSFIAKHERLLPPNAAFHRRASSAQQAGTAQSPYAT